MNYYEICLNIIKYDFDLYVENSAIRQRSNMAYKSLGTIQAYHGLAKITYHEYLELKEYIEKLYHFTFQTP